MGGASVFDNIDVTIITVDGKPAGNARITRNELNGLLHSIREGANLIGLDRRWGLYEKYLPLARIAEIRVAPVPVAPDGY